MSTGFKEALEREIAELEKSLEGDPRFIKLRELQRVAALYSPSAQFSELAKALVGSFNAKMWVPPPRAFGGGGEAGSQVLDGQRRLQAISRQKVLEDAEGILRGRIEPTKTADLYDALVAAGHEIAGDDPKNNLSAMLSKSPLFRSHKRAGWTLVESQSTAPDEDDDPSGSDQDAPPGQEGGIDDLLG